MSNTQFTLNFGVSHGTSNIGYLLEKHHEDYLNTFTPAMIETVFGPGDDDCYIPSKGYTEPEWYWQASNGHVWGIGWRWGIPRLRGKGAGKEFSTMRLNTLDVYEFVEFLKESLLSG